jgi:predicted nucleotidyltransferase
MKQVHAMNRQNVMQLLHDALPGIRERFGVQDLAIFGSVARDEAGPDSDIDVLVTFEGRTRFRAFMGLQFELEALLGTKVDLVTTKAVKPTLRPHIERDLIHVA